MTQSRSSTRGAMSLSGVHSRAVEQARAFAQLRALTEPYRFRIKAGADGFPIIPGRYGQIEWTGGSDLAVYTSHRRLFQKLSVVPGARPHQTGDDEMRAVFPPEALKQVALVIKASRKRVLAPEEARRRGFKSTPRATSGR